MTEAKTALSNAIYQAYIAFSDMPQPREITASPLRNAGKILSVITAAPLRELAGNQIGPYSGWAITTVGDDRDYRHFLPRIFELAISDPIWLGTMPPVMASRIDKGGWRRWPEHHQEAVLHFFHSAFRAALETHPEELQSASQWLCALMMLGESVAPGFQEWHSSVATDASLQLAAFVLEEKKQLLRGGDLRGSFWADVDVSLRREIAAHLISEETKRYLRSAIPHVSDEDRSYFLEAALRELEVPA